VGLSAARRHAGWCCPGLCVVESKERAAYGIGLGMTRHPRMGAAEILPGSSLLPYIPDRITQYSQWS